MATFTINLTDHFSGNGVGEAYTWSDENNILTLGHNQGQSIFYDGFSSLLKSAFPDASAVQSVLLVFRKVSGPNDVTNANNTMSVHAYPVTAKGGTTTSPKILSTGGSMAFVNFSVGSPDEEASLNITNYMTGVLTQDAAFEGIYWSTMTSTVNTKLIAIEPLRLEIEYTAIPKTPAVTFPNGGEVIDGVETVTWSAPVTAGIDTAALKYEAQLSRDNGVSWTTLFPLTPAGSLSKSVDFSSVTESNLAKIRIRAHDGVTYGDYDESDGVFTISHNKAPSAPTSLAPSGGFVDRTKVQRFSWKHNDSNPNDVQSKAELRWRVQGTATWNTITSEGTNQYYDLNSNTLPNGQIEWQVRTTDQGGLTGPYSTSAVFSSAEPSNAPIIIQPDSVVSVPRPVIEWATSSQRSYQILIVDNLGNTVWDTGEVTSAASARTAGVDLANGATYTVKIRVTNTTGVLSSFAEKTITVSYTPPPKPALFAEIDEERGSVILTVANPEPSGTEPIVTLNWIYRRESEGNEWIRISNEVLPNGRYEDCTVANNQEYDYYVQPIGENGTATISDRVKMEAVVLAPQLASAFNPDKWMELKRITGTEKQRGRNRSLMPFAGRPYPLAEFGNEQSQQIAFSWISQDVAEVDEFYALIDRQETLLYRDAEGRKEYVTIDETNENESHGGALFTLTFTADKVWFKEEV